MPKPNWRCALHNKRNHVKKKKKKKPIQKSLILPMRFECNGLADVGASGDGNGNASWNKTKMQWHFRIRQFHANAQGMGTSTTCIVAKNSIFKWLHSLLSRHSFTLVSLDVAMFSVVRLFVINLDVMCRLALSPSSSSCTTQNHN